jgi:heme-degrading monooxygenase HmoA
VVKQVGRKTRSTPDPTAAGQLRPAALSVACSERRKRRVSMFTRVVEITAKSGKAKELTSLFHEKIVPILKKQAGFVDETLLVSDTDPHRFSAMSFWNSREDAERYNRDQYPAVHTMVRSLLESDPVVRTFNVDSSITHKIATVKAA